MHIIKIDNKSYAINLLKFPDERTGYWAVTYVNGRRVRVESSPDIKDLDKAEKDVLVKMESEILSTLKEQNDQ